MVRQTLIAVLLFLLGLFIFSFISCRSFPLPEDEEQSLLVLLSEKNQFTNPENLGNLQSLDFSGPQDFSIRIKPEKDKLHFLKLKAGKYSLASGKPETPDHDGALPYNFELKPGTVFLYPYKIFRRGNSYFAKAIEPVDQKKVAEDIIDYIGFEEWLTKGFEGFGPYRPRLHLEEENYRLMITSVPEGSRILVDEKEWGTTPLQVRLTAGKHLLKLEKDNFVPFRRFIDVTSNSEINITLPLVKQEEKQEAAVEKEGAYYILLNEFINLGKSENDNLKPLFYDVLKLGFGNSSKLKVIETTDIQARATADMRPDFKKAEELGAELLVAGNYQVKEGELIAHGVLYDVKSEMIKTSVLYTGKVGFSIFDSIDQVAERFTRAVSRVLPEIGREIVEEKRVFTQEIITYEKRISKKVIIEKRSSKKNIFAISALFGGINIKAIDDISYSGGAGLNIPAGESEWVPYSLLTLEAQLIYNLSPAWVLKFRSGISIFPLIILPIAHEKLMPVSADGWGYMDLLSIGICYRYGS